MADSNVQSDQINQEKKLKYLDFVHTAAIRAVALVSNIYGYAKENAGPLKPGVQAVEGTVKTVVGPVVDKFHDAPLELLSFVDRKVDESVHWLEQRVPEVVKELPSVARSVAGEVQQTGVVSTAAGLAKAARVRYAPVAKGLYAKYEPTAEHYAVAAWHSVNKLPLVPQVAQVLVPTAAYWSEKYNQAVCYSAKQGYAVSAYLPLVPTERIAKVFGGDAAAAAPEVVASTE